MRPRLNHALLTGLAAVAVAKAAALPDWQPDWPAFHLDPWGWAAIAATSEDDPEEEPDPVPAAQCELPDETFEAIRGERELLADQREDIAARRAELELGREKLRIEAERLTELRDELSSFVARLETVQTADMDRLIALYRAMKPKEAAAIMDEIDMEVLIAVMGAMSARDAAPIMAQLDPSRASAISRLILERARLPGDRDLEGISLR